MARKTVKIEANQRALFVGKTGSGKTYMAEYVTQDIARLICLDPKPSLKKWDDLETVTRTDHPSIRALLRGENRRIRVPDIGKGMPYWLEWLDLVWRMGHVTCYTDEINLIVPPKKNVLFWTRLYQQGRERGIGMWAATQRPVDIPPVSITESDWVFVFRLGRLQDRKKVADDFGVPSLATPIRQTHGFYTCNASWDTAIYQPGLIKSEVHSQPRSTTIALPDRRVS